MIWNKELEEIKLEREILKKREEKIRKRENEIYSQYRSVDVIAVDDVLIMPDIDSDSVNYVMGQSQGFVDGYTAAMNTIIEGLSSEYRDIPMTEDELYLLVTLGKERERGWLKNYKQEKLLSNNGWEKEYNLACPIWKRKETEETTDKENGKE